ncbi:MAG: WS/DGAT/MGAT family O-acyltransferase [Micromonosporaceae bacterium]
MKRLSGLDASFLYLESAAQLMHVCALIVVEPSDGYDFERFRAELRHRVEVLPAFVRRPYTTAFNPSHPVWVDDPEFDIERHVHRVGVPAPGGRGQLAEVSAHIAGQPLDRSRPLWEIWYLEGLGEGFPPGAVALLAKMHHATVDGVTGANLMSYLCSPDPGALPPIAERPPPAEQPGVLSMFVGGLAEVAQRPLRLAKLLPATVGLLPAWIGRARRGQAMPAPFTAPRTSLNGTITPHRAVGFARLDLDRVKQLKREYGTTVNDVVLAVCAGALRRYLAERAELPEASLVGMVPVSLHGTGTQDGDGVNRVTGMFVALRTDIEDPVERLRAIAASNRAAKEHHRSIDARLLQDWAAFAAPTTFGLAVRAYSALRLADRHPVVYNLVISNVPGPPVPIYLLGARVVGMYPLGPVFHQAGLNITVLSHGGQLDVGLIACRERVPELWSLADHLGPALDDLVPRVAGAG